LRFFIRYAEFYSGIELYARSGDLELILSWALGSNQYYYFYGDDELQQRLCELLRGYIYKAFGYERKQL